MSYLRDRLTVARDLLTDSGSVFVQIGDENVHRVAAVMDEVFGEDNFISLIGFNTTSGSTSVYLSNPKDFILWYSKSRDLLKFRRLYIPRNFDVNDPGPYRIVETASTKMPLVLFLQQGGHLSDDGVRLLRMGDTTSQRQGRPSAKLRQWDSHLRLKAPSFDRLELAAGVPPRRVYRECQRRDGSMEPTHL